MQLLVNTENDAVSSLFSAAQIILEAANRRHGAKVDTPLDTEVGFSAKIASEDQPDVGVPVASDVFRADAVSDVPAAADVFKAAAVFDQVPVPPAGVVNVHPAAVIPAVPPVPPQPPGPPAGDIDAEGIPWDERIHSGGRSKTKAGVWTKKKGLNDEALVNRIKAGLRAAMAIRGAATPILGATFPLGPTATAVLPPVPPVPPVPPAPLPAPGVDVPLEALMTEFMPMLAKRQITEAQIADCCRQVGVESLITLATVSVANPAAVTTVYNALRRLIGQPAV